MLLSIIVIIVNVIAVMALVALSLIGIIVVMVNVHALVKEQEKDGTRETIEGDMAAMAAKDEQDCPF